MIDFTLTTHGKLSNLHIAISRNRNTDFIVNLDHLYMPELVALKDKLISLAVEISDLIPDNKEK